MSCQRPQNFSYHNMRCNMLTIDSFSNGRGEAVFLARFHLKHKLKRFYSMVALFVIPNLASFIVQHPLCSGDWGIVPLIVR